MAVGSPGRFLLVAAGGAAGGVLRFGATRLLNEPETGFTWPTLIVNAVGCLALGFLVAGVRGHTWLRPALGTGLLGGFTTFSAVAQTSGATATAGGAGTAAGYLIASVVAGLAGIVVGAASGARWSVWLADRHPDLHIEEHPA